jgi:hypothetical protein
MGLPAEDDRQLRGEDTGELPFEPESFLSNPPNIFAFSFVAILFLLLME